MMKLLAIVVCLGLVFVRNDVMASCTKGSKLPCSQLTITSELHKDKKVAQHAFSCSTKVEDVQEANSDPLAGIQKRCNLFGTSDDGQEILLTSKIFDEMNKFKCACSSFKNVRVRELAASGFDAIFESGSVINYENQNDKALVNNTDATKCMLKKYVNLGNSKNKLELFACQLIGSNGKESWVEEKSLNDCRARCYQTDGTAINDKHVNKSNQDGGGHSNSRAKQVEKK